MSELPSRRRRLGLRRESMLAVALTVLLVLALVEAVSKQQLLFASLATLATESLASKRTIASTCRSLAELPTVQALRLRRVQDIFLHSSAH